MSGPETERDDRRLIERRYDGDVRRLWQDADFPRLRLDVDLSQLRRDVDVRRLQRDANDRRLQRTLAFVAAFAAGFLLAGRRRDDASAPETASEGDALADTVSQVRQRLAADGSATLDAAIDGGEGGSGGISRPTDAGANRSGPASAERTNQSESTSVESAVVGTDEEVAALSSPTAGEMPMLGVGTPQDAEYDAYLDSVREAFEVGYRHIDATERRESYYNEEAVGDAIAQADLPREELFVTTKVDSDDLASDHVRRSLEESLDHFDLDYLDLLYVHWPTGEYDPEGTLEAFAELREEGLIERIGVSNFTVELLEEAIETSPEPIFANQVEMHPLLPQTELRQFCARDDVDVELVAYSPIARGHVEEVDEIRAVADKHGATPEQVSLAWLREKDVTAIPEATTPAHLRENWLSLGLELDDEDVAKIDGIDRRMRLVDPDEAPWN